MFDFLGRKIEQGDYLAYPGAGNAKAEYGLLLLHVLSVGDKHVICNRLDVEYIKGVPYSQVKKTRVTNLNKVVKVDIPKDVETVFNNPDTFVKTVAKWIHGASENKIFPLA